MSMFEPWMLAMMDQAGYNGIREEHIEEVAREILKMGITEVSYADFDRACSRCGVDPDNFNQAALAALERRLNANK